MFQARRFVTHRHTVNVRAQYTETNSCEVEKCRGMFVWRMRFQRCPFPPGQHSEMKTILLVDDEPSVVRAWKRLLQLEGYRILTASDGDAGLVVAREERPDLIITDRSMPIVDGVEFCRQLKLEQALARIPLILTSADPLKSDDTMRWDEFWQKPVAIEKIKTSLLRLLSTSA